MTIIERAIQFIDGFYCEEGCRCERCRLLADLKEYQKNETPTVEQYEVWQDDDHIECMTFAEKQISENDTEVFNFISGFALGWKARGRL